MEDASASGGSTPAGPRPTSASAEGHDAARVRRLEAQLHKQTEHLETTRERIADLRARHLELHGKYRELASRRAADRERIRAQSDEIIELRRAARRPGPTGDPTTETRDWPPVDVGPPPFITGRRSRIRVMLLNSMGGSMGRLSKALMLHEGIEADVMVGSYAPRRHLLHPHEPNVFGIFTHDEWRRYLSSALNDYDVIQSTSMPLNPAVAECYDWLTDRLGRRHVWREIGFVHHYLRREDILPVQTYLEDLGTDRPPGPDRYAGRTFTFSDTRIHIDPFVMFYSSPEKGAYFEGRDKYWLPSMRDPESFRPSTERVRPGGEVRVYVPLHRAAKFKGLKGVLATLDELKADGAPIQVITSDTAAQVFPDLSFAEGHAVGAASYPIPSHNMARLMQRVDVVIDQLTMGCYGNTGIEAMLSGKPVVGQKRYAEVADAPVWDADPDTFKQRFLELLDRRDEWPAMGEAGRQYAIAHHSPQAVAKVAADVYRRIMDEHRH